MSFILKMKKIIKPEAETKTTIEWEAVARKIARIYADALICSLCPLWRGCKEHGGPAPVRKDACEKYVLKHALEETSGQNNGCGRS
jgi:hypothetical protein